MLSIHKAYHILHAFETFDNNSIPCDAMNPRRTAKDVEAIRKRYAELKWDISFAEAARIAKMEFMIRIIEEK